MRHKLLLAFISLFRFPCTIIIFPSVDVIVRVAASRAPGSTRTALLMKSRSSLLKWLSYCRARDPTISAEPAGHYVRCLASEVESCMALTDQADDVRRCAPDLRFKGILL